jgi:hypothetical protein
MVMESVVTPGTDDVLAANVELALALAPDSPQAAIATSAQTPAVMADLRRDRIIDPPSSGA